MNRPAVVVIALLLLILLPVFYVGSYLALVTPERQTRVFIDQLPPNYGYRYGGRWERIVFWPLEQIDRKVRPGAWEPPPYIEG